MAGLTQLSKQPSWPSFRATSNEHASSGPLYIPMDCHERKTSRLRIRLLSCFLYGTVFPEIAKYPLSPAMTESGDPPPAKDHTQCLYVFQWTSPLCRSPCHHPLLPPQNERCFAQPAPSSRSPSSRGRPASPVSPARTCATSRGPARRWSRATRSFLLWNVIVPFLVHFASKFGDAHTNDFPFASIC